jgi:hypothetical protein
MSEERLSGPHSQDRSIVVSRTKLETQTDTVVAVSQPMVSFHSTTMEHGGGSTGGGGGADTDVQSGEYCHDTAATDSVVY